MRVIIGLRTSFNHSNFFDRRLFIAQVKKKTMNRQVDFPSACAPREYERQIDGESRLPGELKILIGTSKIVTSKPQEACKT
jgi:hypothetical protein